MPQPSPPHTHSHFYFSTSYSLSNSLNSPSSLYFFFFFSSITKPSSLAIQISHFLVFEDKIPNTQAFIFSRRAQSPHISSPQSCSRTIIWKRSTSSSSLLQRDANYTLDSDSSLPFLVDLRSLKLWFSSWLRASSVNLRKAAFSSWEKLASWSCSWSFYVVC